MHSVANLATLQNPLATFFFLKRSAQTLFSLRVLPRERKVLLSQHAHTPLSLSLRLSAQFLFSKRTHISVSLHVCSVSVQRAHTHLSLSLHLLRFCSVRGREEQSLIQLNTDIMLLASLILHASIAKSTAIVITLWVFYLIRQQLYY